MENSGRFHISKQSEGPSEPTDFAQKKLLLILVNVGFTQKKLLLLI